MWVVSFTLLCEYVQKAHAPATSALATTWLHRLVWMDGWMDMHMQMHMYMHLHTRASICMYMHMYMHAHACTYICVCMHRYAYAHTTISYIRHSFISPRRPLEIPSVRNSYLEIIYSAEAPTENASPQFLIRPRQRIFLRYQSSQIGRAGG